MIILNLLCCDCLCSDVETMWKAAAGSNVKASQVNNGDTDEWETDPDFVNDVSEQEQRWGAKTVEGSGHQASMKLDQLREQVF